MVDSTYQVFVDLDATALEGGYVWVGPAYGNPEATPSPLYWDAAKTIPAAQPLRTSGGYIVRDGTPSDVFGEDELFSVRVRNRAGRIVYYAGSTGAGIPASRRKFPIAAGAQGDPGAKGDKGDEGLQGPIDQHSESALAALPHLSRAVRDRAFSTTPIKIAGFGSSNMLNEDGGLAGPGNSPVEIALRELKAALDPQGNCVWEFINLGVNGTAYSGWNAAIDRPKSPREYAEEYGPDLLIGCYGTNDYSPENFNVGETRSLVPVFMAAIYAWCDEHNCDVINMIPPMPHVGKSKQTRTDPVTLLPVQGRALNYTVPTSYPTRSFQRGQKNDQAPDGDLLVSFSGGNTITSDAGTFDDSSLYPGAIIWVANPDLLSPIVNGGYYRIASVSVNKAQLVLNNVATVNAYDYVIGAPVALTTAGPTRVTIWRVAIDPFTELTPSFTEAFGFIDVDGTPVEILTREQLVSQDIRQQTAASAYNAVLLDVMFDYVRAVVRHGEDRYYDPLQIVHWNSVCVDEVIAPAFRKLAKSLVESPAGIAAVQPAFVPRIAVRPEGTPAQTAAGMGINRAVDIQMAIGESAVIRVPTFEEIAGALHTEFLPTGATISHLGSAGLPFKRVPIVLVEANVSQTTGVVIPLPVSTVLYGYIFGEQPGVGVQMRRITAFNSAGVITIQVSNEASTAGDVFSITTQTNSLKLSVLGANTQLWTDLTSAPFTYGAYQY
ncbi:hypothetical protein [Sphingomonas sp. R86520]|uniref:hypothetical protein n=1 Tax=Sphingomonas sp. R86520 TaxID=3093859 RepID=UPI0036D3F2FF